MSKIFTTGTLEERVAGLEKYLEDLSIHRDSRRGPEGKEGAIGATGATGSPGKDVDMAAVIKAVKRALEQETESLHSFLTPGVLDLLVDHRLQLAGVIDADGKAILIPGPAGRDGLDSTVAGPKGDTVTGPAGKDGVDGQSIVGPAGRDGKDGADGKSIKGDPGADSTIPGPRGPAGAPAVSLTREDVVAIVIDMAKRGSIPSYGQHSVPPQQPADINTRVEAAVQRALENRAQPVAQQPVSVQPAPVQAIDTGTLADMVASTLQKVLEKQAPKKGILQRLFGS